MQTYEGYKLDNKRSNTNWTIIEVKVKQMDCVWESYEGSKEYSKKKKRQRSGTRWGGCAGVSSRCSDSLTPACERVRAARWMTRKKVSTLCVRTARPSKRRCASSHPAQSTRLQSTQSTSAGACVQQAHASKVFATRCASSVSASNSVCTGRSVSGVTCVRWPHCSQRRVP